MNTRRLVGAMAAFGLIGVGSGGLVIGVAAPAEAFTGDCSGATPAATLVADNVCEVRFTSSGSFTAPTGITKLVAVLVGAGSGAYANEGFAYAGNGGTVLYVSNVALTAPVTVTVGAGSSAGTGSDTMDPGDDTVISVAAFTQTAAGGAAADTTSGCSSDGSSFGSGTGNGGANVNSDPGCLPGAGVGLADLSGTDPALFPAAANGTDAYGAGGTGSISDPVAAGLAGAGGSANGTAPDGISLGGSDGLVIFRFAPAPAAVTPPAPALAATGSAVSSAVPALSAAMIAAGGLLLALRRRRAQGASGH